MTRHEKIGLMCTNALLYTLYYSTYLTFCVRYVAIQIHEGSVNWINSTLCAVPFANVLLINYAYTQSYETSKSKKVVNFYVHISPIF